MMKQAVIVFAKNPVEGKVKTRLAKDIGSKRALEIYIELLEITGKVCNQLKADIHLFYSDFIDSNNHWGIQPDFEHIQSSNPNLGDKMSEAFNHLFNLGYTSVIIIGSDCPYITPEIIENAFKNLQHSDVTIGPAKDGGFYLLGVNDPEFLMFDNIHWSTSNVLSNYLNNIQTKTKQIDIQPELEDLDTVESVENYLNARLTIT